MSLALVHFQNGLAAHNRGDMGEAERGYRAALRADPGLIEARINICVLAGLLAQSLPVPPDDSAVARILICWRLGLLVDGESEPAARATTYIKLGGRAYADFLVRIGRADEAIAYLRSACGPHEHGPWIADHLQQILHAIGRHDEMIAVNDEVFEQAVASLAPHDAASTLTLEIFLGRQGATERSRDLFRDMSTLDARDATFEIEACLGIRTYDLPPGGSLASLRSAIEVGRTLLAPSVARRRKKLVAAMMVRDEIDILADSIACHLNQGVDLVLVTDNGSVDGSRDLLAELERTAPVLVLDEPVQTHHQALWMSRMVHLARDQHGADWVIAADADEIWLAEDRDLPGTIARDAGFYGDETRLLLCQQATIFPERARTEDPAYRPTDQNLALVQPLKRLPSTVTVDPHCYVALYKCIVRTDGFVTLWHGNHFANFTGPTRHGYAVDITILHYPLRSLGQLAHKHARTRGAMANNETYRLVRDAYRPELAESLFLTGTYPTKLLEALRAAGRLREIADLAATRDRELPSLPEDHADPERLRRAAIAYLAEIEPHLPRAGICN